jgi:hypothetical protein
MLLFASLVIIVLMIALNALYVCAEFAVVSVRRTRLQQYADQGRPLALKLLPIVGEPAAVDRYIAACQVGITLTSLILGAFGQVTPVLRVVVVDVGSAACTVMAVSARRSESGRRMRGARGGEERESRTLFRGGLLRFLALGEVVFVARPVCFGPGAPAAGFGLGVARWPSLRTPIDRVPCELQRHRWLDPSTCRP